MDYISYLSNNLINMFGRNKETTGCTKTLFSSTKNNNMCTVSNLTNSIGGTRPDFLRLNSVGESTSEELLSPDVQNCMPSHSKRILDEYKPSTGINHLISPVNSEYSSMQSAKNCHLSKSDNTLVNTAVRTRPLSNFAMAYPQSCQSSWPLYGTRGHMFPPPFHGNCFSFGYQQRHSFATCANPYYNSSTVGGHQPGHSYSHKLRPSSSAREVECPQMLHSHQASNNISPTYSKEVSKPHCCDSVKIPSANTNLNPGSSIPLLEQKINNLDISSENMASISEERDADPDQMKITNLKMQINITVCKHENKSSKEEADLPNNYRDHPTKFSKFTVLFGEQKNACHKNNTDCVKEEDSGSDETINRESPVQSQSSSHSPPNGLHKKNSRQHQNNVSKPNQQVLAQVLLRHNISSKKKKCRPSAKKRSKLKARQEIPELVPRASESKDTLKSEELSNENTSKSSCITYILGLSSEKKNSDKANHNSVHCKVSLDSPAASRFCITIGSSEESDSDFTADEDDSGIQALSDDDADLWNSFLINDPYNPLNFENNCLTTPIGMSKSSSAPTILTPDVHHKSDPPVLSPPKPEALFGDRKKVQFLSEDLLVEVHTADDWDRKGPWEQMALDSHRFKQRILEVERKISWILTPQHRRRILLHTAKVKNMCN